MIRFTFLMIMTMSVGCADAFVNSNGEVPASYVASVASYESSAEWDHFDDGTFATYDRIKLIIISPDSDKGRTLSFTVPPSQFDEDSPFRRIGTRLTFLLDAPESGLSVLAWGSLRNPTVLN